MHVLPDRNALLTVFLLSMVSCGGGSAGGDSPILLAQDAPLAARTFTSPAPTSVAFFGASVGFAGALSVVGSPNENKVEGGAFSIETASGALRQSMVSPTGASGSAFGFSVASNTLLTVVGAPQEADVQGTPVGALVGRAYAFSSGTTTLLLALRSENEQDDGLFGFAVAVAGQNIVVGAPGEDTDGLSEAGRVYYFDCEIEDALTVLSSPNPAPAGNFGFAVAARGFEIFVGAPGEFNGEGRVYWFDGLTGALRGTFASPNASSGGGFGASLAVDGDRLVVGAPGETDASGVPGFGAVYVFDLARPTSAPRELRSPDAADNGRYGTAVAVAGPYVYGGAPGEGATAGRVQVFNLQTGEFLPALLSPNEQAGGGFGAAVSASGANVIVGAPQEDVGQEARAGRAYLNP